MRHRKHLALLPLLSVLTHPCGCEPPGLLLADAGSLRHWLHKARSKLVWLQTDAPGYSSLRRGSSSLQLASSHTSASAKRDTRSRKLRWALKLRSSPPEPFLAPLEDSLALQTKRTLLPLLHQETWLYRGSHIRRSSSTHLRGGSTSCCDAQRPDPEIHCV